MKKTEPDMTHLKAIALDLRGKGYQTNYLGEIQAGTHGVYIQNPDLTKTIHIHCRETTPHIVLVNSKKYDLTDPDSIPQIYAEIDKAFQGALPSLDGH